MDIGSSGERELQKKLGTERRARSFYQNQMLTYLNDEMLAFVRQAELCFIATSDAHGECDCSLRSGEAGFFFVENDQTIYYPEYRGNGVMASLGNISENPHIGLMFIDFYEGGIGLHVNGKAEILANEDFHLDFNKNQKKRFEREKERAERWVKVSIEEAYIHCSKHIPIMKKADKKLAWGTDDAKLKGGDYFKAKNSSQRK
ncbi:MAG: pyridoxamine 5'-phosphate oxidase family protein [Lentisphaeraceae bacterium]|nr:pyridoxamine 5'-phosphate oxidase family protein [Lentisphaeraceae bacterium]